MAGSKRFLRSTEPGEAEACYASYRGTEERLGAPFSFLWLKYVANDVANLEAFDSKIYSFVGSKAVGQRDRSSIHTGRKSCRVLAPHPRGADARSKYDVEP